jgi:catechol 2,3-dioxygenase-like lactoylglutathione lyase family enzyme
MKTYALLFATILALFAHGNAGQQNRPRPIAWTAGTFFAISVSDMPGSVSWYRDKFGLGVVMQTPKQNGSAVTVLEGGGMIVELIQKDGSSRPAGHTMDTQGIAKVGIVVNDFEKLKTDLRARGIGIFMGPWPARNGQRANLIIQDNEGNLIQFFGKV